MKASLGISSLSLQTHDKDRRLWGEIAKKGFGTTPSGHHIAPAMFVDAKLAST